MFLGYLFNHFIRITSSTCNLGMQTSFGSPSASVDDIHTQSYLDSFDYKKKVSIFSKLKKYSIICKLRVTSAVYL